jgi:hypothetical protein
MNVISLKAFLILLIMVPCLVYAQKEDRVKEAPKTKIEELSLKAGEIIKKEYLQIAEVESLTIKFLTVTSNNNTSTKGLYLSARISGFSTAPVTRVAYLDGDEIGDMITFLKLVKDHLDKKGPDYQTEFHYNTRSDFRSYLYSTQGSLGTRSNSWRFGFDFERYLSVSSMEFKNKSIDDLISAFEKAKSML